VVAVGCLVPGFFLGGYDFTFQAWWAAAYTGVAASAVAFGCMVWAQQWIGPSRTALLLMVEPVFAGVAGYLVGDRLGALGGSGATVPELDIKMRLGTHCYHHAWHSELWHKRLPELREMNPDRLCVPPNDAFVTFVDAVTEPEAPELTIEKLVGVYRVLIPHKIAAYTYHLNATSTITDAPTIRSLKFVLQDELDDWRDGEMML